MRSVRNGLVAAAVVGALVWAGSVASAQEPLRVAGTRVRLPAGEGFVASRLFVGLQDPLRGIDVVVAEFPAAYASVLNTLADNGSAVRRYVVDRREEVRVGGRTATWVQGRMPVGMRPSTVGINPSTEASGEGKQWMLVGNAAASVLITASYPLDRERELQDEMRTLLLGAIWEPGETPDVLQQLPFTVVVPGQLRLAGAAGGRVIHSEDGRVVPRVNTMAMLTMLSSRNPIGEPTEEEIRRLFQSIGQGRPVRVAAASRVTVAGLSGWEVVGEVETSREVRTLLYAMYLFNGEAMYQVFGQVGTGQAGPWVERFRLAARSLRASE